jgi:hypothetical protein
MCNWLNRNKLVILFNRKNIANSDTEPMLESSLAYSQGRFAPLQPNKLHRQDDDGITRE